MKATTRSREAAPLPPLHSGDRMTQEEFHRRYQAYPEHVKAELIGGVVYMASPLRNPHGEFHLDLAGVFFLYKTATPGVRGADNATTILGEEGEPQPDLVLRIVPECGGQAHVNEDLYLVGGPELIAEVAHSTRAIDLGQKRKDYLAAGVQEYLVYCVEEKELHWFHFPSKRKLKPDGEGVWKSRVFPGLWIDGPALVAQDSPRLVAAVQRGLATPEHAAFVRRLEKRRKR